MGSEGSDWENKESVKGSSIPSWIVHLASSLGCIVRVADSSEYLHARGEVPAGGRVEEGGEVNKLPLQMCVSGGQLLSLSVQQTFILQRLLQQVSILAQTEEYHIC